ncbi:MAG: aminotransferase class IV [Microbacteriaceae bacterium]
MSVQNPPMATVYNWRDGQLIADDIGAVPDASIVVADSWFVSEGTALAIGMHRERFFAGIPSEHSESLRLNEFWTQAIALIPSEGQWFPRVELHKSEGGGVTLVMRLRSAPERSRSAVVATWRGEDLRSVPLVKGPDLEAMSFIREALLPLGAQEGIILSPDGYIVEGAYSSLVWWRGNILCAPANHLARVDSVTAKALLGIAGALGTDVHFESVTPAEIDGTELWALSALHGPRIVTTWIDGPHLAELPGRLALWRGKLEALRRPLG